MVKSLDGTAKVQVHIIELLDEETDDLVILRLKHRELHQLFA
jgi:hypothetical protein